MAGRTRGGGMGWSWKWSCDERVLTFVVVRQDLCNFWRVLWFMLVRRINRQEEEDAMRD